MARVLFISNTTHTTTNIDLVPASLTTHRTLLSLGQDSCVLQILGHPQGPCGACVTLALTHLTLTLSLALALTQTMFGSGAITACAGERHIV